MNLFDKAIHGQEKERAAEACSEMLEEKTAGEVIRWAADAFPNLVLACSFGAEDVVLVDLIQREAPGKDIFYLDTDLHFAETYMTRDKIAERYGIRFIQVKPKLTLEEQAERYGDELWKKDPNQCCFLRKVEPLAEILSRYDAWITGIRREQAPTRANAKKMEYDAKFGLFKFNPLADWTTDDVWAYIHSRNLIYNPLHDQNYPSIGCEKCTLPVRPGDDPRAGRWAGFAKTECGLHQ